jgi:CRP-like cAMP-binding protein
MTDGKHVFNRLLAGLPAKEYKRLEADLEPYDLSYGHEIFGSGDAIKHVYFPNSGIVSLLSTIDDHSVFEVGIVGKEGMVGLPLFLGVRRSSNTAVVQGAGESLRIGAAAFNLECGREGQMSKLLRRFAHSLMSQISQSAVCFRFHSVEQRLARWLLMTSDRMGSNDFQLTQEFLSNMLGVRREAVNRSAVEFHSRGLINYVRGQIKITNRRSLKLVACKCYDIIRAEESAAVTKQRFS